MKRLPSLARDDNTDPDGDDWADTREEIPPVGTMMQLTEPETPSRSKPVRAEVRRYEIVPQDARAA